MAMAYSGVEGPRFTGNYALAYAPKSASHALALWEAPPAAQARPDGPLADDLMRLLQVKKASQADIRSRAPFAGDRGTLSGDLGGYEQFHPSQLAPTRPASPSVAAANSSGMRDLEPGDLPKEVAAREVELRVLRGETEARDAQAAKLRDQVRDAELALQQASGTVGTLSAKVEATSGNRHAVLEASARHIDGQVVALRKRLERTGGELAQKGEEVETLRRAIEIGSKRVEEQRANLEALRRSHTEHGQVAAAHEEDKSRLQRHKAIGEWRERVHAQIAQEELDAKLVRERREKERQIEALEEDMGTFRSFLHRMEDKCKHHAGETKRLHQQFDEVVMEERLCVSAARLGHETAHEQKKHHLDEHRALEARIQEEITRKAAKAPHAQAYDEVEADAIRLQSRLAALIACTREISCVLQHGPHPSAAGGHAPRGATAAMPRGSAMGLPSTARLLAPMAIGSAPMMRV